MGVLDEPIYRDLGELAGLVWIRVCWDRIGTSARRRQVDIFQHRVLRSSYSKNLSQFWGKLCQGMSVQCPDSGLGVLARLQSVEQEALRILRTESQTVTLLAREYAREQWSKRKTEE